MLGKINFWAVAGIDDPAWNKTTARACRGDPAAAGLQFLRESQRDRCAAIHFALDFGRPAVKIDNRFHQRQAQPSAGRAARGVDAIKAIEYTRQMFWCYSAAIVANCYFGTRGLCCNRYLNCAPIRRETQCIINEVLTARPNKTGSP